MKSARVFLPFAVAALFLFVIGCDDDDGINANNSYPQQPSSEDMEDVADDFGAALAGENEGMLEMWRDNPSGGGASGERGPTQDALDDTLIIHHDGITAIRIRNFYNDLGQWSEFYMPGLTVRMDQFLSVEGTHTSNSGNRSVTLSHHDTIVVLGLLPSDVFLIINGAGNRNVFGEFHSHFHQNVKTFEAHYVWTVSDLRFRRDIETYPYPVSGVLHVEGYWRRTHTNPGRDFEETVYFSFTVNFDDSRYAEMRFDGGSRFWIDLVTGHPYHNRPGDDD
jgi:hypothetical protein